MQTIKYPNTLVKHGQGVWLFFSKAILCLNLTSWTRYHTACEINDEVIGAKRGHGYTRGEGYHSVICRWFWGYPWNWSVGEVDEETKRHRLSIGTKWWWIHQHLSGPYLPRLGATAILRQPLMLPNCPKSSTLHWWRWILTLRSERSSFGEFESGFHPTSSPSTWAFISQLQPILLWSPLRWPKEIFRMTTGKDHYLIQSSMP